MVAPGRRPVIGVTGPDRGGAVAWMLLRLAILRAGGRARRITPSKPCDIAEVDGLIISGGADVSPSRYPAAPESQTVTGTIRETRSDVQQKRIPALSLAIAPLLFVLRKLLARSAYAEPDPARDALESSLLEAALHSRRPVLGICRGAQLLNVVCGGSLHRDLRAFYVETPNVFTVLPKKEIEIAGGTCLARVLGAGRARVNALHRQAVRELGRELYIAAREPNGVVQAIERRDRDYVIGVQWHPEYMPQLARQQALFGALVRAAQRFISADHSRDVLASSPSSS